MSLLLPVGGRDAGRTVRAAVTSGASAALSRSRAFLAWFVLLGIVKDQRGPGLSAHSSLCREVWEPTADSLPGDTCTVSKCQRSPRITN